MKNENAQNLSFIEGCHVASVNGFEMYYEVLGKGSPLILLHEFGRSGESWKVFFDELSKHYCLIIPDFRGHGRSTNPTRQFTHRQSAIDILVLLDQLKIDQFKGIGICNGGMALLHMVTQHPARVEAMVLIGTTTYIPEEARVIMRRKTVENMTIGDWERLRTFHKHGDDQIRLLVSQFHNFKDSYDDMNFTKSSLSKIKARTLIIHGDRDPYFPVSIPVEMYNSIANSYLWIIPNGEHIPIRKDKEVFMQKVLEFLRGEWDRKL